MSPRNDRRPRCRDRQPRRSRRRSGGIAAARARSRHGPGTDGPGRRAHKRGRCPGDRRREAVPEAGQLVKVPDRVPDQDEREDEPQGRNVQRGHAAHAAHPAHPEPPLAAGAVIARNM